MNDFMIFIYDGAMEIETPYGTKILKRGEFLLSAPGEFHSFGFTGNLNYVEHLLIHCQINFPNFPFRKNLFATPFLKLTEPDSFLKNTKTLAYLWGEKSPVAKKYAENILKRLFIQLSTNGYAPAFPRIPLDTRISRAVNFMRDNFQSNISIKDVASQVNLSEVHLRKIFREQTKHSPLDLLTEIRLQHSCVLLQNPSLKIKEISETSGFNNVDYFCRLFKKNYRCTPSECRQNDKFL
jgi:AraC-like DNA-binding protein